MKHLLVALFAVAISGPLLSAQPATPAHLTINVELTPGAHGGLAYLIFDSPAGFPGDRDKALRRGYLKIVQGETEKRIQVDLPAGTYAVSVYEDLNGNHKLDHNLLGIPSEPAGASNNPHPHIGPPHFHECSFHLGSTAQTIDITLVRAS